MGEHDPLGRDKKSPDSWEEAGGTAVRNQSSAPGIPASSDAPTMVPPSSKRSANPPEFANDSDAPTLVPPSKYSSDSPTMVDAGPVSPIPPRGPAQAQVIQPSTPVLEMGTVLAARYEIQKTLGEGGMGAVYRAKDIELDRMVALKVIRPELAKHPAIIDRFKQELLLSQKVTHRNVIRIYDLGEGDGVKFITMEFIEGEDLRSLIFEKKKFPPLEAVQIMEQVCLALEAAHSVGVIHRDLKPQNIMQDKSGRILVMDFGLARNMEGDGMTQSGALVGTMEYMSPEQALAKELDQRSDIFSAGLIFYEMLTGQVPYRADSALASLIRRTQERAAPISSHDASIPQALSNIVSKCLEREAKDRYQSAAELRADLEAWQGKRAAGAVNLPSVNPWGQDIPWPLIGGIAAVLVLGATFYAFRGKLASVASTSPVAKTAAITAQSLAILPFHNSSGDPAWDWLGPSMGDMLSTDVGQSAHLRTVSPDRLQQVLHDLHISPGTTIDSSTLQKIAQFVNADIVVSGQYAKLGDSIRIDATLQDLKHGRTASLKAEAPNQQDLSTAVDKLADGIRQNLALSPDLVQELRAQSFKTTSKSVAALRDYNEGVQLSRQGNNLEALKRFQSATTEDSGFALAFSKLGETYSALGYDSDAEQASRHAMDLSQDLPLSEKYLIEASHYLVSKDNPKAIAAYQNLEKSFPDNLDVQYALASLYEDAGDLDKARAHYTSVLNADSKNLDALLALGRVEIKSGNPQAGLDPLARAKTLAIDVNDEEQEALVLQATGIAYKLLNKPQEALRNYEDSMAINRRLGQKRGVAASLEEIAQLQDNLGKTDEALKSYNEALQLRREIGAKKEVADTLIDIGSQYIDRGLVDKALPMFKEALQIERDSGDEANQALCLNNIGNIYLAKGENDDALTYFQQALQLREKLNVPGDIAETLHNLGGAYVNLGNYDQATASYMRALDLHRKSDDGRGAASESQSLGLMFLDQGRIGPSISALQDAVNGFRTAGDHARPMAESLVALADALARAGRGDESAKLLDEAQAIARDLKSDALNAEILNTQGDVQFYAGNLKPALDYFQQAMRGAAHTSQADLTLVSKLNLAKAAIAMGQGRAAMTDLRSLIQKADELGRKPIAVEAHVDMAEAMIKQKDYAHAREELNRALDHSEKYGLRLQTAKIHYFLGEALRLSGNSADSTAQYRQAVQLLDDIRKEPGAEKVTDRFDLKPIYSDATQRVQSGQS